MATLADAKQVRERLKPLRRLLDDIDTAVDFAEQVEVTAQAQQERIATLKADIAALEQARADADEALKAAQQKHARRVEEQDRESQAAVQARDAELQALRDTIRAETQAWADRRQALEADFRARSQALAAEIAAAQARRDALQREAEEIEERLGRVLTRR